AANARWEWPGSRGKSSYSQDHRRNIQAKDSNPQVWIAESAALRESLYPVPISIDEAYICRELPRGEERLALAGIRTAAWLNAILDEKASLPQRPAVAVKGRNQE
ncbi:MAG: hypothetical protein ACI8SI_002934, partial [Congregibacter sp.]